jgi:hypothetical protein
MLVSCTAVSGQHRSSPSAAAKSCSCGSHTVACTAACSTVTNHSSWQHNPGKQGLLPTASSCGPGSRGIMASSAAACAAVLYSEGLGPACMCVRADLCAEATLLRCAAICHCFLQTPGSTH